MGRSEAQTCPNWPAPALVLPGPPGVFRMERNSVGCDYRTGSKIGAHQESGTGEQDAGEARGERGGQSLGQQVQVKMGKDGKDARGERR